ncbi:MAG: lysS [Anaerolineales bacterium]|nr:lysS [Anaerolineales bacterium]
MTELNDLERIRLEKAERLRLAGMEPYPARARRTHTTAEALRAFEAAGEQRLEAVLAGRLRSIRVMGKAAFAHLEDRAGLLQLYFKADDVGAEAYRLFQEAFDLGDFVEAAGFMFRTRSGETSLHVEQFRMLAKALSPLPAAKEELVEGERVVHHAFANPEARYRERYADLAVNPEVRQVFLTRARVVAALREFLDGMDFVEVETPTLQPLYGGAAARPFTTHHEQLHQDLYLRISFELYLKRLLVGGLERVYEIGRDFRNEGVSFKHNPEFTQLEFYMAYADYEQVMEITERMVAHAAQQATGNTSVVFREQAIALAPPWHRLSLRQAIGDLAGIDIAAFPDADSLRREMRQRGLDPSSEAPRGKLVESLLSHFVEPKLIQPTFLIDYPRDISPLAKSKPGDPSTVERFEGFVGGMELCNAFTELNDPLDQEQRFLEMGRDFAADDEARHPLDEDYLQAMRYGMPPNGGFGMGVDRLVMLLTDRTSIREVILFPHLRPKD